MLGNSAQAKGHIAPATSVGTHANTELGAGPGGAFGTGRGLLQEISIETTGALIKGHPSGMRIRGGRPSTRHLRAFGGIPPKGKCRSRWKHWAPVVRTIP